MTFESMPKKELEGLHSQLLEKYNSFKAKNLKLDMSRGMVFTVAYLTLYRYHL